MRFACLWLLGSCMAMTVDMLAGFMPLSSTGIGWRNQDAYWPTSRINEMIAGRNTRCPFHPLRCATESSSQKKAVRGRRAGGAVPFLPKQNHPTSYQDDPKFAYFKACNSPDIADRMGVNQRERIGQTLVDIFDELGDYSAGAKLARELAKEGALDTKEFFEAFEFYERVRKRVRQPVMVDMACGHGFCGLLFAALERSVEHVILVDRRQPPSFELILNAVQRLAPWTANKVSYLEEDLSTLTWSSSEWHALSASLRLRPRLPLPLRQPSADQERAEESEAGHRSLPDPTSSSSLSSSSSSSSSSNLSAPASERCASDGGGRGGEGGGKEGAWVSSPSMPAGVRRALGKSMGADVARSFRLQASGYHVDWAAIPQAITPMNRILIATPRSGTAKPGR